MKITMPIDKNKDHALGNRSVEYPKILFRPRPYKAGEKVTTKVIIPPFSPTKWSMFNPTPDQVSKYGLVGDGSGLVAVPQDLITFTFNLAIHPVDNFTRPDGSQGQGFTLCPKQMNEYLTQVLEMEPLFKSPKCAFCEEEQRWWDEHNARWEQLGINKKDLNQDGYWAQISADPILKNTHATAKKYRHQSKNIVAVFNYSKMLGEEQMEENESLALQLWYSPKSVLEKLYTFYEEGIAFYDFDNGVQLLKVIKNTKECSGNNLMKTKYDMMQADKIALDQQWVDYLSDPASLPDPSSMMHFISYEEQKYYISGENVDYNNAPNQTTETKQPPKVMAPPRAPSDTPENVPNEIPSDTISPTTDPASPPHAAPPVPQPPAGPPVPMIPGAGTAPPPEAPASPVAPQPPVGPPQPPTPAVPRTPPPGDRPPSQIRNWD